MENYRQILRRNAEIDNYLQLLRRNVELETSNAELETELRLTKEQLDQLRTSNQYMLDHFSTEDNHRQGERAEKIQKDLDQASQENEELKATLRLLTHTGAAALMRIEDSSTYTLHRAESSSPSGAGDLLGLESDAEIVRPRYLPKLDDGAAGQTAVDDVPTHRTQDDERAPRGPRPERSYGRYQLEPFQPRPNDPFARRTVIINRIPPTTTLAQVLDSVRGGKIVSAIYAETRGMRLKTTTIESNATAIIFLHARGAANFIAHTKVKPLSFMTPDGQQKQAHAEISEISSRQTRTHISFEAANKSLTRVLYIYDAPEGLTPEAASVEFSPLPLSSGYDDEGIMYFEFASMQEARDAAWIVTKSTDVFQGAKSGYLPDPCDRPADMDKAQGEAEDLMEFDVEGATQELQGDDERGD